MNLRLTTGKYGWLLWVIPLILILVLLAAVIIVASIRDLTSLEIIMFQVMSLGVGLFGSFWLGRFSAMEAARDLLGVSGFGQFWVREIGVKKLLV